MEERKSIPELANRGIVGNLIGRLTLFVRHYAKTSFHELGVGSMDEFKVLSLIWRMQKPNKSMLSHAALMEFTTINDMLKRMQNEGWVKQVKDKTDKRSSLVMLTDEGSVLVRKIYQAMANIEPNLAGDLSDEEQEQLMGLLNRLNHFHTD